MAFQLQRSENQYLELGNSAGVNPASLSISIWFRPASWGAVRMALVGKYDNTTNRRQFFLGKQSAASAELTLGISTDGSNYRFVGNGGTAPALGEWHHVLATYDSQAAGTGTAGFALFVNGVAQGLAVGISSGWAGGAVHSSDVPVLLGRTVAQSGVVNQFDGDLAEFAMWSDVLTAGEAAELARGFSPLALGNRWGELAAYQDLVRPLDRPGHGPAATAENGPAVVAHPPVQTGRHRPLVFPTAFPWRLPLGAGAALATGAGAAAGQSFIAGAVDGAGLSVGEVI